MSKKVGPLRALTIYVLVMNLINALDLDFTFGCVYFAIDLLVIAFVMRAISVNICNTLCVIAVGVIWMPIVGIPIAVLSIVAVLFVAFRDYLKVSNGSQI